MGYWKSKVLPTINKVFKKDTAKKAAAAEACKSFDGSKEEINKEFDDKKSELQPKVIEIYEASSAEIKTLVKEPKDAGLKKHSSLVQKFLDELAKIEFPGSKAVAEVASKYGTAYVSGPVLFIFEKVSAIIPVQETASKEVAAVEETSSKEKEIIVEGEKKEEVAVEAEKKTGETPGEVEAAVTAQQPAKVVVEEASQPPAPATEPPAKVVEETEPPKP